MSHISTTGTQNVIDACKICKVKSLIYTSSSGVVFDGVHGLFDINESLPYPEKVPYQIKLRKPLYILSVLDVYIYLTPLYTIFIL
jgi:nucleoside-diphosphate-sugar epimerase